MVASIRPLTRAATRPFPSVPQRHPLDVARAHPELPEDRQREAVQGGSPSWLTPNFTALQIAHALDFVAGHHREQRPVQRASHNHERTIPHGGLHRLIHRIIGHRRLTAHQHRDTCGMHGKHQLCIQPVFLVITAFLCQKERPIRRRFRGVIDRDLLQLRKTPAALRRAKEPY